MRALLGPLPLGRPPILHGVAVFRDAKAGDGVFSVLRVSADTPPSPSDAFALQLARARADAILTSGQNLRDEPASRHTLPGSRAREASAAHARPGAASDAPEGAPAAGLRAWRSTALGLDTPPRSVVLTRDPALDLDHPILCAANRPLVLTSTQAAPALARRARATGVEIVGRDEPDLRGWIAYLHNERGLASLLVEAGPSTARALYAHPPSVDELVLSICPESAVRDGARGPAFLHEPALARAGLRCVHEIPRDEPSGRWTFRRYLRTTLSRG